MLMLIYTRLQARTARPLSLQSQQSIQRVPRTLGERLLVGVNVVVMLGLLVTPLLALAWRSITVDAQLSLAYYRMLWTDTPTHRDLFFVPPGQAIANSLMFALATVIWPRPWTAGGRDCGAGQNL